MSVRFMGLTGIPVQNVITRLHRRPIFKDILILSMKALDTIVIIVATQLHVRIISVGMLNRVTVMLLDNHNKLELFIIFEL